MAQVRVEQAGVPGGAELSAEPIAFGNILKAGPAFELVVVLAVNDTLVIDQNKLVVEFAYFWIDDPNVDGRRRFTGCGQ